MSFSFDDWILANAEKITLQVEDLNWIQNYYENIYDFQATISVNGQKYFGRGHGESKDLALRKAVSEAIERAVCLIYVKTTNGVASHTDYLLAQENSKNELIERDLFLSHFLTKTPFFYAEELQIELPKKVVSDIQKEEDRISVYKMKSSSLGQGFVCLIEGVGKWGGIIGLSFGTYTEKQLILKASLEATRQYYHRRLNNSLRNNISVDQFLSKEKWDFSDNGDLCLNVDYFSKISHLFARNNYENSSIVKYDQVNFNFKEFVATDKVLASSPLHIVQCEAEDLQFLNPGPTKDEEISMPGLIRFTNKVDFDLETLPHPIR